MSGKNLVMVLMFGCCMMAEAWMQYKGIAIPSWLLAVGNGLGLAAPQPFGRPAVPPPAIPPAP